MLPAPLRGAATLLAVLALAALLTTVRHNASAYLTGVWDTGSQTLVYGRIHQMEQGQHAPGGFLGVYTDDWSDDTNRALFRDDTPTDAAAFHPYTPVSYTHLRAHETDSYLVCRLLLEKKKNN